MTNHNYVTTEEQFMTPEALLASREIFYGNTPLKETLIACGDERASDYGLYISLFGGGTANTAYNYTIMAEVKTPGSSEGKTFAGDVVAVAKPVKEVVGVKSSVHSTEEIEGGNKINPAENAQDVDCGYLKKRAIISALIAEKADKIIADAKALRPELFSDERANDFASEVTAAHGRMAKNSAYFTTGRDVANAAIAAGEESMVVRGEHVGREGIINLVEDTSINGTDALAAGLATYEHDAWAGQEIRSSLSELYPYDSREMAIADLIDAIGTMRALGVETIAVRR